MNDRLEIASRILAAMHTSPYLYQYSNILGSMEQYALAQADALIKLCGESEPKKCEHEWALANMLNDGKSYKCMECGEWK